ncbi:HAD-IIIC family phosphatase [Nocardia wallacei]|uniref:HAD-IIIC family phosphatase n=1 Tax=Nocardia wallacei TaxID=480035 RepID=UPI0024574B43|nr:HAD-IIIC family phosphatase [Nocardia wallacei]
MDDPAAAGLLRRTPGPRRRHRRTARRRPRVTRRCLVVDLDNTLWGGVLGEAGFDGVSVGAGRDGEDFARFQDYLLGLRRRGIILAVASKNDADLVADAFERVPGMRLRRNDFAAVVADWRPKSEQLRDIAAQLRLHPRSLAFVDDNPAECAEVSRALPEVDVIALPSQPALYIRALADRPTLTPPMPTAADDTRAQSYAGLHRAEQARQSADTLESFLDSLNMSATVRRATPDDLPRVAQLTQKTNQFNLTTRRRSLAELTELADDAEWWCGTLELRDRFADHGLVGVVVASLSGPVADIDTLLLSCRVIGRTAERLLLAAAADAARAAGCHTLRGRYVPTDRNALVRDMYRDVGFTPCPADGETGIYDYDLTAGPSLGTPHIVCDGHRG